MQNDLPLPGRSEMRVETTDFVYVTVITPSLALPSLPACRAEPGVCCGGAGPGLSEIQGPFLIAGGH